jgi:hypothetical protein
MSPLIAVVRSPVAISIATLTPSAVVKNSGSSAWIVSDEASINMLANSSVQTMRVSLAIRLWWHLPSVPRVSLQADPETNAELVGRLGLVDDRCRAADVVPGIFDVEARKLAGER